jgi:hypothetical protein
MFVSLFTEAFIKAFNLSGMWYKHLKHKARAGKSRKVLTFLACVEARNVVSSLKPRILFSVTVFARSDF